MKGLRPKYEVHHKARLTDEALEAAVRLSDRYDPICGARPMRRALEKHLEDPLADELLRGNIKQGNTLEVHAAGEQLLFKVTGAGAK